jgi:hypothetical protein
VTRVLLVLVVIVSLIIAAVIFVPRLVSSPPEPSPEIPSSVAEIRSQWANSIKLPTVIPKCYEYAPDGADVKQSPAARDRAVLMIRFSRSVATTCQGSTDADLVLGEAAALQSLIGDVTTVSDGRIQYARLAEALVDGRIRLTLQWYCEEMMCRLSGNLGDGGISEQEMLRMTESVRQARS